MKCLTIRQPWAWAIIDGMKTIENRSRPTRYRGDFLIHAGLTQAEFSNAADFAAIMPGMPPIDELTFGAITGIVRVIDCVPLADVAGRPFAEGPWCWMLEDPRPLVEPIPWKGQLGLFEVPDDVIFAGVRG